MTQRPNDKSDEDSRENDKSDQARRDDRTEARRNKYKVAVDAEEGRRRREDGMIEIRKNKRLESLLKKRRGVPPSPAANHQQYLDKVKLQLQGMAEGVRSNDVATQLDATTQIRKLLSIERNPPIEDVVQSGVVPYLVQFLARYDLPQLQHEAGWALTNIASGTSDHTRVVIEHGAVPLFVNLLLNSTNDDVREQAVWALGNIAGDSTNCRDFVLNQGALMAILNQFNERSTLSMLRNATWALSNLCRGKPRPDFELTKPALPTLALLLQWPDEEVLIDACYTISYLSDCNSDDRIQAVVDAGVCPRLVQLLLHAVPSVVTPALRAVGNIVSGNDRVTQAIIDSEGLQCLAQLLSSHGNRGIRREACWAISNITAGPKEQIQAVVEAGVISPLLERLSNDEFEVKREAAWAVSNAVCGGTHEQVKLLVNQGCIKPLCDLLVCPDPGVVAACLEGLESILKVGEADKLKLGGTNNGVNVSTQVIEEVGRLGKD